MVTRLSLCLPGYWTCLWPPTWSQSRTWSMSSSTWAEILRVETSPGSTSEKSGMSSTHGERLRGCISSPMWRICTLCTVKKQNTCKQILTVSLTVSAQLWWSIVHEFKAHRWSHRVPEHRQRTQWGKYTETHSLFRSCSDSVGQIYRYITTCLTLSLTNFTDTMVREGMYVTPVMLLLSS